jgi:hypothetical protein
MTDTILEYCDSRGVSVAVDRQAGVIRGVKVLGLESRNGRTYLPEALAQAAKLYEDSKVNVNHPKGSPSAPRDYQDRLGSIRNISLRPGEGLFADLHFNPKHALAEQLAWDAEHSPENVGFSHNVEAWVVRRDGRVVVEAITRVQSVDLVADPATTRGLFESANADAVVVGHGKGDSPIFVDTKIGTVPREGIESLDLDDLKQKYPELVESIRREQSAEIRRLQEEIERLAALDRERRNREMAKRLLGEYGLPDPDSADPLAETISGDRFLESLAAVESEQAMRELVAERAKLVRTLQSAGKRPQSRDQLLVCGGPPMDARSFVEAIT